MQRLDKYDFSLLGHNFRSFINNHPAFGGMTYQTTAGSPDEVEK